ncbi:MAG: cohesin domain-containing protein [Patescibacteria group bacterium]
MKKIITSLTALLAFVVSAGVLYAADFKVSPSTGTFGAGKTFSVNLTINTFGESVNAAQGKLQFDASILEVKSVSKEGSIFNFWLQEPTFSNDTGVIEFIGGTPSGVSGSSLKVLSITFSAKTLGTSELVFTNASITASDGSGTNISSNATGASFNVSSGGGGALPGVTAIPALEPVIAPVQIKRAPVQASGLPAKPNIKVQLYPNPDGWYNLVSNFTVSWDLPPDIAELNTALNQNPNFEVPNKSEGLFDSKAFPALSKDGIYYLHARFKNNIGWGPTAHYRVAIDTQPPLTFNIDVPTGIKSDNPSPKLVFNTGDALSGIGSFKIIIEGEEPIEQAGTIASEYTLKPHPPGIYMIRVVASDKAGNSIDSRAQVEISPLDTPKITSVTEKVVIGTDDTLIVKGTAITDANVVVSIEDKDKFLILQNDVATNKNGEWEFRLDRELRRGDYFVTAKAKDSRGALSLPTSPIKISYVEKAVISLFGLDITLKGLLIIVTIGGILAAGWFWRKTLLRLARSQRESVIISRDLSNAFDIVKKDLDQIAGIVKKDAPVETREMEFNVVDKKIKDTLDKIDKYSSEDIENLN